MATEEVVGLLTGAGQAKSGTRTGTDRPGKTDSRGLSMELSKEDLEARLQAIEHELRTYKDLYAQAALEEQALRHENADLKSGLGRTREALQDALATFAVDAGWARSCYVSEIDLNGWKRRAS